MTRARVKETKHVQSTRALIISAIALIHPSDFHRALLHLILILSANYHEARSSAFFKFHFIPPLSRPLPLLLITLFVAFEIVPRPIESFGLSAKAQSLCKPLSFRILIFRACPLRGMHRDILYFPISLVEFVASLDYFRGRTNVFHKQNWELWRKVTVAHFHNGTSSSTWLISIRDWANILTYAALVEGECAT